MADEPGQENSDAPSSEDKLSRSRLVKFAIAGAILLVVILWVWVKPSDPTEKKDFIQAVGVLLAALAGLGGLYFTSQNLKQTRRDTEKQLQQARNSQQQTQRLTEQGQITERFTRAIDQLGKVEDGQKLLEIRLGGIYALERIAKESEEDYWPIMEILTAYIRQNASLVTPEASPERTDHAADEQGAMEGSGGKSETTEPSTVPGPDIQAIISILGRRKGYYWHGEPEPLDLSVTNLLRADLSQANLSGAYLRGAYLRGANLSGAYLRGADLYQAFLIGADLPQANLSGANLSGAYLSGADLSGADLSGAKLLVADLRGADLRGAYLRGVDLRGAKNLFQEQLEETNGDEYTQLPPHLKPPAHWGMKTDEQTDED